MKLTVEEVRQNEDGTTTVEFDYDEEFLELAKKEMANDNPSEEEMNRFIMNLFQAYIAHKELKQAEESKEEE